MPRLETIEIFDNALNVNTKLKFKNLLRLTTLRLNNNQGLASLWHQGFLIQQTPRLQVLDLQNTGLVGAPATLPLLPSLKLLKLQHNPLADIQKQQISEILFNIGTEIIFVDPKVE